jgi:hydroxymethylpyrimidine pyrophosphatase-like HAD family hydrolase
VVQPSALQRRLGGVDIATLVASKAVGVAEEMAERRYSAEATVVFCDMPNDLPLLAWAARASVVANGHPEVLAAADEVVPRNDDDGVARTVQRLLRFSSRSPLAGDCSETP